MAAAPAYLGRQVTITNATGDITGVVEAIKLNKGKPAVVVNGKTYETNLITGIAPAPMPAPALPITSSSSLKPAENTQS